MFDNKGQPSEFSESQNLDLRTNQNEVRKMDPEEEYEYYKSLNIYSKFSCKEFLNKLWINRYCCYPWLIDKAPTFLELSKKILGERITFGLVNRTIGKVFTGGETLYNLKS